MYKYFIVVIILYVKKILNCFYKKIVRIRGILGVVFRILSHPLTNHTHTGFFTQMLPTSLIFYTKIQLSLKTKFCGGHISDNISISIKKKIQCQ